MLLEGSMNWKTALSFEFSAFECPKRTADRAHAGFQQLHHDT